MSAIDKDLLRKFYFSGGSNFNAFKGGKKAVGDVSSTGSAAAAATSAISASHVDISTIADTSAAAGSPATVPAAAAASVARPATRGDVGSGALVAAAATSGGAALSAVRTISSSQGPRAATRGGNASGAAVAADAASSEYFAFLKQQQEIQRTHNRLDEGLAAMFAARRERQAELTRLRGGAADLLGAIETSTDWKLKSKYDVAQLVRDCNLALQPSELVDDKPAQTLAVTQLSAHLNRLRGMYGATLQFQPYERTIEQALRRLHLVQASLAEGNMDATHLTRICDTLLVQLEQTCKLTTLEDLIKSHEATIERATFAVEQMRASRGAAVEEGEVHAAERLCYEVIQTLEGAVATIIAKAQALDTAIEENDVNATVSAQYHSKTPAEFNKVQQKCAKLKARCLDDIKKMFALREKVEEVEAQTAAKVAHDRELSDRVLADNNARQAAVFAKMEELERELEVIERERHKELLKRLADKDKDEHRRAEYARFCATVDAHLVPLERTVRNMDLMSSAATAMQELVDNGFNAIAEDLSQRGKLLRDVKTEAHKEHTEVFRSLLLELGDIIYRKERMVEETDKKVQQAHVQQELLAETFNPNAKRFGDMKKSLLTARDDLEAEVADLKARAAAGLSAFGYSEQALTAANVPFVHPVTEQAHHTLAMRAKMIEFKAMVVGHVPGNAVLSEIDQLKRAVQAAAEEIHTANADTSGSVAKALPMIRAANKTRFRQSAAAAAAAGSGSMSSDNDATA